MRYVTLIRLGSPALKTVAITLTIPYNGEEFEFLAPEWRGLARRAAAAGEGYVARDDRMVAQVFEKE
jgi:hypothetical protein